MNGIESLFSASAGDGKWLSQAAGVIQMHLSDPGSLVKVPAGHRWQSLIVVIPTLLLYVPAGHLLHPSKLLPFISSRNLPGGQGLHASTESYEISRYVPSGQ